MAGAGAEAAGAQREAHLLVTLLDLSDAFSRSLQLENPAQQLTVAQCLDSVTTFVNSYLLLEENNSVGVCISHSGGRLDLTTNNPSREIEFSVCVCVCVGCSRMVYPVADREGAGPRDLGDNTSGKYEPLVLMNTVLTEEIHKTMAEAASHPVQSSSALSGALSKCLCYVQRCCREAPLGTKVNSRILVIMSSPDLASQYVSVMNCIFAAQRNKVVIDSCVLWQDSCFLQQASDITGGIYVKIPEPAGLLQFLIWTFLPDVSGREKLMLPSAVKVDYQASCFCHHQLVEIGHVCSVCLAIFCQFTPICSMCQAHFKLPSLPLGKGGKSKKKKNAKLSRT